MALSLPLTGLGGLGILTARECKGSMILGGLDVLAGATSQAVTAFQYEDNTNDQADDLMVLIADPSRTWMQTYLPKKGVETIATLTVQNWKFPGDSRIVDCGIFWIDQINFTGPPNTVAVRASSIPVTTGFKNERHPGRSWENVTLMQIATQIAVENGLLLVWNTKETFPPIKHVEQVDKTDAEFLNDKLKEKSLRMKIYKRQLVVYSEEEYEARPAVYVITYGLSNLLSWSFSSKLNDTYKKAKVSYVVVDTAKLINGEFTPTKPPEGSGSEHKSIERPDAEPDDDTGDGGDGDGDGDGPDLRVDAQGLIDYKNTNPGDNAGAGAGAQEAADRLAKAKLRDKNKREKECEMVMVGNPDYLSGLNVQLVGWGVFDGKWFISSTIHSITSSGYTTELKMRACLEGY